MRAAEAVERNRANVAWIQATYAHATASDASAVVIAMHASLFDDAAGNGDFGKALHGDYHEFVVDRPFLVSQGEVRPPKYGNVTRLQVFGAPELRAVRVNVDTATPWVFGFEPLYRDPEVAQQ